jgi:5-methylcytosine-specific restriction enzyme subunit McrC
MKPEIVTLFEHQSKSYKDLKWASDDPRIGRLEKLVLDSQTPFFTFDRHSLRAAQYVGVVRLGNLTIQILPKIDYEGNSEDVIQGESRQKAEQTATRNLLALLTYTHDLQLRARDLAELKERPSDWFELLTRLFASELHTQLRSGLEHSYIHHEDNLPVIRGRWLISRQLAMHPHIRHRFDVSYDEFSPETPLNQIFRFVTQKLLLVTLDAQNRRYLQVIRDWLDEIPTIDEPIQSLISKVNFSRLNDRFRPAFNLAKLFLESQTFQLSTGDKEVFAFVLDMNRLFEEFIGNFIIRHWKSIEPKLFQEVKITLKSQGKRIFLAENLIPVGKPIFQLIPDIQFAASSGRILLIGDTKYKQLNPKSPHWGVSESDLYQMLAYSIRLDCPKLLLLYPQTNIGTIRSLLGIQNQNQTVRIATLNLHIPIENPGHLIEELHEVISSSFVTE